MNSVSPTTPTKIAEQAWPAGTIPVVSICCITYNQKHFIAEAIDGFLMQETTFPVEIIVHDDASTDGTADIVREYQTRYPILIRSILQAENQYSKGNTPLTSTIACAKGEFIALCEGDDLWTHTCKLEMQVAYLREHPHVVLSFHDVFSVDSDGGELSKSKINTLMGPDQPWILHNYAMISKSLIPTLSVVYRNLPYVPGPRSKKIVNVDSYLFAMLARYGEMHNVGETMGAHRRHGGGLWTSAGGEWRRQAILQTQIAIAWEIDPSICLVASTNLAQCGWYGFAATVLRKKGGALKFLSGYLVAVRCCFRYLRAERVSLVRFVQSELIIIFIPIRHIFGSVVRRLVRRVEVGGDMESPKS